MNKSLAFVGREERLAGLRTLYASRKSVVIVGPPGIGKTALLIQVRLARPLLICEDSSSLRRICDSLERQLGWDHHKLNVIERKNRLLVYLMRRDEPVAFDHAALIAPRVARFIAMLNENIPVWIACRSTRRDAIGHLWECIYDFTLVEIPPLTFSETQQLIFTAADAGNIQDDACRHGRELYNMSKGNPRLLEELLIELAARKYKMDTDFGLNLLGLDRRIHEIDTVIRAVAGPSK
ncbi:MAG: hypothetical protein WCE87_02390 [Candidatus Udaeobacter sp.]